MKVLISDKLTQDSVSIFKSKGIRADYLPEISREEFNNLNNG